MKWTRGGFKVKMNLNREMLWVCNGGRCVSCQRWINRDPKGKKKKKPEVECIVSLPMD